MTGTWLKNLDGVNVYKYENNAINLPENKEGYPSLFLQFYITINNKNYPISGAEW
jgi:hypothetical protein